MPRSTCRATFRFRQARSGLVTALLFATAGAAWRSGAAKTAQPVSARIDASKTRAPISKYVYGQFIEHIAGIINTGLWAEMLDDRKFFQPVAAPPLASSSPAPPARGRFAPRRWVPVGPADAIVMDAARPYAGDHSPLVTLNGTELRGIGNEAWGDWQFGAMSLEQFVVKHNLFAKAMKRVDPTIQLVASGAMPDTMTGSKQSQRISGTVVPDPLSAADWTGGLLLHCLENTDLISEHFYAYANRRFDLAKGDSVALDAGEPLVDWMRRPANHVRAKVEAYQDYLERIPALKAKPVPINLDEWAYSGVPPNSYKVVPAYAWTFHEMFRHSELYQMAGFIFATSLVSADRSRAVLNPAGLVFQLYRDRFGTIPIEVTGNSPQPPPKYPPGGEEPRVNAGSDTFPLDVVAAWTADRRTLTVAVINPTESVQQLELAIAGVELAGTACLWRMAPADLNATIVVGQTPGVVVEEMELDALPATSSFAAFSVTVYALPVK